MGQLNLAIPQWAVAMSSGESLAWICKKWQVLHNSRLKYQDSWLLMEQAI